MSNAAEVLWHNAERDPEHIALSSTEQQWSYAELRSRVESLASRLLERGVAEGERVLLLAPSNRSAGRPGLISVVVT